jgi:hypothetical protein
MTAPVNLPGAWYDVGSRIDEARAVISCASDYMETLPSAGAPLARTNHIAALIAAAGDLLDLAQEDVNELERQLISA